MRHAASQISDFKFHIAGRRFIGAAQVVGQLLIAGD
jgi:hypothetical protein